jgi:hypothetical protein
VKEIMEKLEAALTGSRELDEQVGLAIGWHPNDDQSGSSDLVYLSQWRSPAGVLRRLPMFTRSVDDILSDLLPSGWDWTIESKTSGAVITLTSKDHSMAFYRREVRPARTPVLGLCIAALDVREAGTKGDAQ